MYSVPYIDHITCMTFFNCVRIDSITLHHYFIHKRKGRFEQKFSVRELRASGSDREDTICVYNTIQYRWTFIARFNKIKLLYCILSHISIMIIYRLLILILIEQQLCINDVKLEDCSIL